MSTVVHNSHLARLIERIDGQLDRCRALAGDLNEAQLRWSPPEGGWGVGQIIEHLVLSAEQYYDVLAARIAAARTRGLLAPGPPWKRSVMGKWLIKALESPRKVRTVKHFVPQDVGDRVVDRFVEAQTRIAGFMRDADGVDLSKVKVRSPAIGMIRYNLADCFTIIVVHADRHLNRVEEIVRMSEFPATTAV